MRRLTTGIRSEKLVVGRSRRCAKVTECTYTNLDSIAYYTPRPAFLKLFSSGATFISQNVLRTTLLLGLSNPLGLP